MPTGKDRGENALKGRAYKIGKKKKVRVRKEKL